MFVVVCLVFWVLVIFLVMDGWCVKLFFLVVVFGFMVVILMILLIGWLRYCGMSVLNLRMLLRKLWFIVMN